MERPNVFGQTDESSSNGAISLYFQGEDLRQQGELKKALACYLAAERIARASALHDTVIDCLNRRIDLHLKLGEHRQAQRASIEGLTYVRLIEKSDAELTFIRHLGRTHRELGHFSSAIETIFEGLELARDQRNVLMELDFILDLTEVALSSEDIEGAHRHAKAGLNRAILVKDSTRARAFAFLIEEVKERKAEEEPVSLLSRAMELLPPLRLPFSKV